MATGLSERMGLRVHPKQSREPPTYLVSLLPICCRSSSRSSSVCRGRMFFSSSSRLEGLLLSLMAKESFLHTFMAREPAGGERGVNSHCQPGAQAPPGSAVDHRAQDRETM